MGGRELYSLSAFPSRMPLACQVGQVFAPDGAISLLSTTQWLSRALFTTLFFSFTKHSTS